MTVPVSHFDHTINLMMGDNMPSNLATAASADDEADTGQAATEANDRDRTPIDSSRTAQDGITAKFLRAINWMPTWCRYDPDHPPKFTLAMNILFAFV